MHSTPSEFEGPRYTVNDQVTIGKEFDEVDTIPDDDGGVIAMLTPNITEL